DELAIVGSANFDRRAWGFQTEVAALIFDTPASVKNPSFAQRLRIRLWAEHLGVDQEDVRYGLGAVKLWLKPGPAAAVRAYDPLAGRDTDPFIPADDYADPPGLSQRCNANTEAIDEALNP